MRPETITANTQIPAATRQAGVCLHVTSLPGRYGIGEIGSQALAFVDTIKRMQLGVWQFLPLGPTAYGDSPYQPLSTFAGNEMLIDIADLIQQGLLFDYEVRPLTALAAGIVDYGRLIPTKTALLRLAAERFEAKADSALKAELDQFIDDNDDSWLRDYALFRILKSAHGERPWPEWQPEYAHYEGAALQRLEKERGAEIAEIKTIQYLFHRQWQHLREYANESGVRLFGDMPIYIALDSADAWANREILRINDDGKPQRVAGVPPDYFSIDGQLWGNPLYDWQMHAGTGYRWWIDRMRASLRTADMVRIDHFIGFENFWSVPADAASARDGVWESGPGGAIFDAVQRELGHLPIVAENLGVITPAVEALRHRHQIPGMVVLQFSIRHSDFSLDQVPENCVCYTGTHDNDTTLGWFRGSPDDMRSEEEMQATRQAALELTGGSAETISMDLVRTVFSTKARLAIAPMQDYLGLGSEARLNTPGTSSNNWRWRILSTQLTGELCDNIASTVISSGRELHNDRFEAQG